jgi:cell division protein FtsQ
MITSKEINSLVINKLGEIEGSPLASIDLYQMEKTVSDNPYVSSCEVFQTIGGNLVLKARVREPLVRIINQDDDQFYIDITGCVIPVSTVHPSHVVVANGFITDKFISIDNSEIPLNTFPDSSVLHQVFPIAYYISKDDFLKSFIDQIYITEKKEIELVPKIGSQTIIFGDATDAKEKLENLKTFYQKVMSNIDWNTYKSINLKYKNQVVCLKYSEYEQN